MTEIELECWGECDAIPVQSIDAKKCSTMKHFDQRSKDKGREQYIRECDRCKIRILLLFPLWRTSEYKSDCDHWR